MPKKVEQYKKLQKNKQGKNKYTAEYKLNNPIFTFLCCFLCCFPCQLLSLSFAVAFFHRFEHRPVTRLLCKLLAAAQLLSLADGRSAHHKR